MQQPSPAQSPIVTLSSKHMHSLHYQPIHCGSTSILEHSDAPVPMPEVPTITRTTFLADPNSSLNDPLPLLSQGHRSATGETLSHGGSLRSINALDIGGAFERPRSATGSRNSLRDKLIRPFSRSNSVSKRTLVQLEPDGAHVNPMFDYENLDDVHADELRTPELGTGPPTLDAGKMFEINLNGCADHAGHDHGHGHSHTNGHAHNHHSHHHKSDTDELAHCHDDSFDSQAAIQARNAMTKLVIGLVLCAIFMIIELVGGWLSKSLAIFTDAAHLTSDLVSFLISLVAIFLGQRRPTHAKSFGYYRFEVLGVLVSIFTIWILTAGLIYLAMLRIIHQNFEIDSQTMLIVSSIGLGMNLLMMFVLSGGIDSCFGTLFGVCGLRVGGKSKKKLKAEKGNGHVKLEQHELGTPEKVEQFDFAGHGHSHDHGHGHSHAGGIGHGHSHMNMNVRAAILHIVGDILQSIGVLIAAIIVHFWPHLKLADPICTLIFGVIVFLTTARILSDTMHILMEGTPRELSYEAVKRLLLTRLPDVVVAVHSLHIWALTHGRNALMVHVTVDREKMIDVDDFEMVRVAAERIIRKELGIGQTTIQVEYHQPGVGDSCLSCVGPKE